MTNLFEYLRHAPEAKIFLTMVWTAGFAGLLKSNARYTIFVPTDEAFKRLSPTSFKELLRDKAKLAIVTAYHIVPEKLKLSELVYQEKLETLFGLQLPVKISDEVEINVDDAYITQADMQCSNGILHVVDSVLIPKLDKASLEALIPQLITYSL